MPVAFGSLTRNEALTRTAKNVGGRPRSDTLKPYESAVVALFGDIENNAGQITLAEGDKVPTERGRLIKAFLNMRDESRDETIRELPDSAMVVKRNGSELIYYIDPAAPPAATRAPRKPKTNASGQEAAAVLEGEMPTSAPTAPATNGKAPAARVPVGAVAGKGADEELEI